MSESRDSAGHLDLGRVVGRTLEVTGRNFATFALLALIFAAVPEILPAAWSAWMGESDSDGLPGMIGLFSFISYFGSLLLQAAIVHGTIADLNGSRARVGPALFAGLGSIAPLFVMAVLSGLALVLAALLLIIPSLILMSMWAVAVPARVVEKTGVLESLARSRRLTKDHRWGVFGLIFVFFLGALALQALVATVGAAVETLPIGDLLAAVFEALASAVGTMISSVGVAVLYVELRALKEGIGVDALASVFD